MLAIMEFRTMGRADWSSDVAFKPVNGSIHIREAGR